MDAALKKMFTLRQIRDLGLTALKDSSFGDRDILKPELQFVIDINQARAGNFNLNMGCSQLVPDM
jgi:hypothetical protein